jgi:phage terminase large subunit-like protein
MSSNSSSQSATRRSVPDWLIKTAADQRAIEEGCWFDEKAALHVCDFFRRFLRHSKGQWAGQPFELLEWQRLGIVYPLFGWRRADGRRRFRLAYIEVPKKNGKSSLCAGFAIYLVSADGEMGAEVYSAATDRGQAGIIFGEAANMVDASPALSSRLDVRRSVNTIACPKTRSIYKTLSKDSDTAEGKNISGLLFDELHTQPNRILWDSLAYGGSSRRQPLLIAITTAGTDTDSICYEQHEYAEGILKGTNTDTSFFPYIAAADKHDDWREPAVWKKANPSFGITIDEVAFESDFHQAVKEPRKQNSFRRYRLNQWTEQETRWIDLAAWDACRGEIDLDALEGRACMGGLDLSVSRDLTAFVLNFKVGELQLIQPYFWMTKETAKRGWENHNIPYFEWADAGLIEIHDTLSIDYRRIREKINELGKQYRMMQIAFDPANAHQLTMELGSEDGFDLIQFRQGYLSMSPACKIFEEALVSRRLVHDGNKVLRWMAGNVSVIEDNNGCIRPAKPKRESPKRIDGIPAMVMTFGLWSQSSDPAEKDDAPSVFIL